jgi:hypothetical protein
MTDAAHEQIDVAASPARCFAVASAFESYPEWTSDVKQVTVLERDGLGRGKRVEFHVAGLGRRVRYVLAYDFSHAPHAFSWTMVEGDLLRALDGTYAFAPTETGTHVDYTLRVELAVPMPGLVKRRASGMIMGNALRDLKRAVEAASSEDPAQAPAELVVEHDMATDDPAPGDPVPDEPAGDEPAGDLLPAAHPEAVPFEQAGTEPRPLPPPSILESVVTELLGAVPEVKDHVLEAADALLDAAKALIDAADRVVRQQRGEE